MAAPEIHAHRGGTLTHGDLTMPENSMRAFRRARNIADVVELDAKLTKDGVPVVMHDATLDRTTNCTGPVNARTAAELAESCRIDVPAGSGEPIPTLREVLDWASEHGVRLNLEIKNVPTDPDFDVTPRFATAVLDAVQRSGIDPSKVLIQSFWPLNLDLAQLRGFDTSLLTLGPLNEGGVLFGTARLYDWVSPQWPPSDPGRYVALAHTLGKKVVPYTLNTPEAIEAAAAAGVDAVITDDPLLARQVLHP